MASGPRSLQAPLRYDQPEAHAALSKRQLLYMTFTVVVCAIVLFGLVEGMTGTAGYGIDAATARASAGNTTLTVRYARATRGQLVAPFEVTITRQGGFDGPVTLAVSRHYLDLFITNAVSPSTDSETGSADAVFMTFDAPPAGDILRITWDVVTKPASFFTTRDGFVSIVDSTGTPEVTATFETLVHA